MASIGILGGDPNETAAILTRICQEKGQHPQIYYHKITENNSIPIVSIDEKTPIVPKVFILQEATNYATEVASELCVDGYLIVNADGPLTKLPAGQNKIITYGFNGKASVTASSVTDESVQVCIQRGFQSLSGLPYEPQEFKAECSSTADPLNVLGAVTACAVCDVLI